jgi:hypothetical protein
MPAFTIVSPPNYELQTQPVRAPDMLTSVASHPENVDAPYGGELEIITKCSHWDQGQLKRLPLAPYREGRSGPSALDT